MLRVAALLGAAAAVAGHNAMVSPPSWHDADGSLEWKTGWAHAGCSGKQADGEKCQSGDAHSHNNKNRGEVAENCVFECFTNYTMIPGEPSIAPDSPMVTYPQVTKLGDWNRKHPWRAPGTAPIASPCGINGGNPTGCPPENPDPKGCGCDAGGYGRGVDPRSLPGNVQRREWVAGEEVEVAWGITANHGGGYQYRLCPATQDKFNLTEECFQRTPLRLVGNTSWIHSIQSPPAGVAPAGTRVEIPAVRTTDGTHPEGSQWTRNPIPACVVLDHDGKLEYGSGGGDSTKPCVAPLFPPPVPGLYGWMGFGNRNQTGWSGFYTNTTTGERVWYTTVIPDVLIVDKAEIPASLTPGDYVLSFRYDSEQTTQVWNQCADVRINPASAAVA